MAERVSTSSLFEVTTMAYEGRVTTLADLGEFRAPIAGNGRYLVGGRETRREMQSTARLHLPHATFTRISPSTLCRTQSVLGYTLMIHVMLPWYDNTKRYLPALPCHSGRLLVSFFVVPVPTLSSHFHSFRPHLSLFMPLQSYRLSRTRQQSRLP